MSTRADARTAERAGAWPRVELCGIAIDAVTERGCVEHVLGELAQGRGGWITTPNLDHLRRLVRLADFRALCAKASLVVADGAPLVWASRLQRTPLPERVAGSDLISSLTAGAARDGRSVFLLGGDPGTAEGAAAVLRARHPTLRIAGTLAPEPGFERDPAALARVRAAIVSARPDIVFVALGSPKQELMIDAFRMDAPGAWWLGIGISFSFLTGAVRRAPPWMRRLGLEWVHRLAQEPRRLARRYLIDGLPFAVVLFARSFARSFAR